MNGPSGSKPAASERRVHKIVILVSLDERQAISQAAAHESLSSWVRRAALAAVGREACS